MRNTLRCWAEVDLDALRGNLAWIRHRVGPQVKIMTVVKADAYGHGLKQIAALLMQSGTDVFGVANLTEARAIHSVGRGWPVLMLGACLPGEVELAVTEGVMPTISTLHEAKRFSRMATLLNRPTRVHIKVDTGMGRLGVAPPKARELIFQVNRLPGLKLEGLYTHYSSVEDDAEFSRAQRQCLEKVLNELSTDGIRVPLIHANNSGALLHEPHTLFDLVRPGLLVYGVVPRGRRRVDSTLANRVRPALSFKCRVSLVKEICGGTSLSYGRTFVARRNMRVATLTTGYGDGYGRAASNRSKVLIGGQRCPVLGRVTMDQMMVDVSRVRNVRAGDEAVLIGRQNQDEITAGEVAAWCGTVPWEVLTAISYRVPRIYRGSQAA
jgi:alanine racemase